MSLVGLHSFGLIAGFPSRYHKTVFTHIELHSFCPFESDQNTIENNTKHRLKTISI